MTEGQYHTLGEVAELLQVSERTIHRWIKSGALPAYKPGGDWRIQPGDLELFLEARRQPIPKAHAMSLQLLQQLLEEAGTNTYWLAVPEDELREATSGRDDDEKKANLIKIARESLLEWQALQPYLLAGWNPTLECPALKKEEDEDTWLEATRRVIKIYLALGKLLATSEEQGEYEKEATELVEEFRGLSLVP